MNKTFIAMGNPEVRIPFCAEEFGLLEIKYITFVSNRKKVLLRTDTILYAIKYGKNGKIYVSDGTVYETMLPFAALEQELGEGFIRVNRSCIVSAMAIHDITEKIILCDGTSLEYSLRKKKEIIAQLHASQKKIISSFAEDGVPQTEAEYREYYKSFDYLPFAFTDIEMIFNEERHAVDWIFRYGNQALARLEKLPLEQLIGSTFSSLFSNMDFKWLRSYERATLYGEILEIIDYSPEVDTWLKVICFPTIKGHCGCILFDISEIKFTKNSVDAEKALRLYFGKMSCRDACIAETETEGG